MPQQPTKGLVLRRKRGEAIVIGDPLGDECVTLVIKNVRGQLVVCVAAGSDRVQIDRSEVTQERLRRLGKQAKDPRVREILNSLHP